MSGTLKLKRGLRAALNALASASGLKVGEPYVITDEGRLAVATAVNAYSAMALQVHAHVAADISNLLAAVSQANGAPTGGIIERGSNANGDYVRFADGTQICWYAMALGAANTVGAGTLANMYRTDASSVSAATSWTFPVAFATPPVVQATAGGVSSGVNGFTAVAIGAPTATAVYPVQGYRGTNNATPVTANLVAIGRWF